MKFVSVILLSVIATIAFAQRPWYLGQGQVGLPTLSARFQNNDDKTATPAPPNLNDYYNVPPKGIPIDAHGDIALVNRLRQWPEENQPFWLLNADQIEAHRGTHRNVVAAVAPVWVSGYGYYGIPQRYPYAYNYQNYFEGDRNDIDGIVLLDD